MMADGGAQILKFAAGGGRVSSAATYSSQVFLFR